jgi:deazaflavin-dependent oxidoreductase (nitroreductase family)
MPGKRMAGFNKRVTNRVLGLWAPYVPPWAVITHTGRRSGATYRTPVAAFLAEGKVAVSLAYGNDVDWVKNLVAAGGGELTRGGKTSLFTNVRVVARGDSVQLPARLRRVGGASPHTLLADLRS